MKYFKTSIILTIMMISNVALALQPLPNLDMSKSKKTVVEKHIELLNNFKKEIGRVSDIKKGSLYGELGMFYQAHEFFLAAKTCYENAIELSKYDQRWSYLLAFIESQEGNVIKANQLYKNVISINSDYIPAYARLANNEFESGDFEEAKKTFNQILKKQPEYARALVGMGTISMQQGEPDKAISYYNKALKVQPRASQINFLISQAYAAKGETNKAKQYRQIQGTRPVVMFDKILQEMHLHSVSSSYYAQSAINAFMSQNYNYAETLINKAIELDNNDVNLSYTLLNIYLAKNKNNEARKLTFDLIKKYPKNERLFYVLALTYDHEKNYDKAIEYYKKAMLINPNNKTVNLNLAEVYLLSKNFNAALVEFRRAQKFDSENPYPIFKEALILSHLKLCHKAIPKYLQAIEKKPNNFEYLISFVNSAARCKGLDKQIRVDALNAARNIYNISPSIPVIQALAAIELAQGNQQNAVDYQAQAIFQGLTNKLPNIAMLKLKKDFQLIKKGIIPE